MPRCSHKNKIYNKLNVHARNTTMYLYHYKIGVIETENCLCNIYDSVKCLK